ncbi:MAG: GatB/YqeY domain-containing protein [bacterium]|nr:GatB/YqeY domain-containing protein [bacterium]
MSKIDVVRAAMVEAMKAKDKERKESLSMLLSALKNAQIDKREPLTEEEENAVVKKEIRQTRETYDMAPADRQDIRDEAAARIVVYQEFAPVDMTAEQIAEVIDGVLAELGIEKPSPKEKGAIMKVLMPRVKGKADGKLVNQVLADKMK